MKKYSVLGNCQSGPIADLLRTCDGFSQRYEYVPVKPVHTIDPKKDSDILEMFDDLDLLIYQPVVDERRFGSFVSSRIVSRLGPRSVAVCVPPLYYGGYFPTFEAINWLEGPLRSVHDYFLVACFLNNLDEGEALSLYSSDYLSEEVILSQHRGFINGLRQRENKFSVDVRVSDFINENFQKSQLFYTFNHPTPDMLIYLCNSIISLLSIDGRVGAIDDRFSDLRLPIASRVKEALGLDFPEQETMLQDEAIDSEQLILKSYESYRAVSSESLKSELLSKKSFIANFFH